MSTLARIPAAVKPTLAPVEPIITGDWTDALINDPNPRIRARGFALLAARESAPVELDPAEDAPADDDDRAPYAADDQAWWSTNCDHTGWTHPAELSPDEQDEELDHLDRYNAALEAMYAATIEAERIEAGCYAW